MKKIFLKCLILLAVLITGCSADLTTKEIVKTEFKEQSAVVIDNLFNITYVENYAVAFGFMEVIDKSIRLPLIFFLVVIEILFLLYIIWRNRNKNIKHLLPLVFILAGAFGNNIDRAVNGFVTDFLHLHYYNIYDFYVFNIADIMINVGAILLIIQYRNSDIDLFNKKSVKI